MFYANSTRNRDYRCSNFFLQNRSIGVSLNSEMILLQTKIVDIARSNWSARRPQQGQLEESGTQQFCGASWKISSDQQTTVRSYLVHFSTNEVYVCVRARARVCACVRARNQEFSGFDFFGCLMTLFQLEFRAAENKSRLGFFLLTSFSDASNCISYTASKRMMVVGNEVGTCGRKRWEVLYYQSKHFPERTERYMNKSVVIFRRRAKNRTGNHPN